MTAYDLLSALRDEGIKSPPIVYRALKGLEAAGRIHRLDQLNAYRACTHAPAPGECPHHHASVLLVCQKCHKVVEYATSLLDEALHRIAATAHFTFAGRPLEIAGLCERCSKAADQ